VSETAIGLAQLGAIGLIALFLVLVYKVATPVLTAWVTRKTNSPPEPSRQPYEYNQQLATLIYDNSKNMSELVVAVKNNTEILKEVVHSQQQMFDVLKTHSQKSEQFHDTYSKTILKKLESFG
jgi:hypothetical protein